MAGRTVAKRFYAVKRECLGLAIPALAAAQDPEQPLRGAPRGIDRFEPTVPRTHDKPARKPADFEILLRETTDPRRSFYEFAHASGETALEGVPTDNPFFAVRAVGKNGARSIPVAAALEPPAPRVPAK
jgi:hypothetical protein